MQTEKLYLWCWQDTSQGIQWYRNTSDHTSYLWQHQTTRYHRSEVPGNFISSSYQVHGVNRHLKLKKNMAYSVLQMNLSCYEHNKYNVYCIINLLYIWDRLYFSFLKTCKNICMYMYTSCWLNFVYDWLSNQLRNESKQFETYMCNCFLKIFL